MLLPIKYQLSDSSFAGFVRSAGVPADEMQIRQAASSEWPGWRTALEFR